MLRSFFGWAVECEYIVNDPTAKLRRPKVPDPERWIPTEEHVRQLIGAQLDPAARAAIQLMALRGLRKNEVMQIQWRDVNFATGELTILAKGRGRMTIPLVFPEVIDGLRNAMLAAMGQPDHYLLFPHKVGNFEGQRGKIVAEWRDRPLKPSSMQRRWAGWVRRAGMDHFGMHALRHFAVTLFLRITGNLELARMFARHKRIDTTSRVYAHLGQSDLVAAMLRVSEAWA